MSRGDEETNLSTTHNRMKWNLALSTKNNLKNLLTNLIESAIMIIQGKERNKELKKENKKNKKSLDKLPNLWYNKYNKTNKTF